ncbi:phospholipid carrier-dependent glycosyltransferase [Candidatus Daviesbacteria bacterium]|nr:phospholipid carrier-dependent glycosyltransferase [Candidatus Daviesbacteria bacterium]
MKYKILLFLILLFALFTRFFRLDYPPDFYFDEVYNAFTVQEFVKGNKDAYEWFHTSPIKDTAYGWTHPPLAKLIDATGLLIFGNNAFGWRAINAFIGVAVIFLVFLISKELFDQKVALLAAFLTSVDGLLLVQSRINMNDIVFTFFALLTIYVFIKKTNLFILGISLGLTLATKWTGLYLWAALALWTAVKELKKKNLFILFFSLFFIPVAFYILFYSQYFLLGGTWDNFLELQKQMWWYNTNLKATHDYGSAWWSWPLNLYPVWYFVEYQEDKMANIFAGGNPLIFWFGTVAVILTVWEAIKKRSAALFIILLGYFIFWLPWVASPRVMFLYHYTPSVPFLTITLGYQINKIKNKYFLWSLIVLITAAFVLLYPFLTGILLPKEWLNFFFLTNLSKNPF